MADSNILTPLPDDGTRGPRLEIDEFCLDNEITNLFLIALSSLQQKSLDPVDGKPNWINFYAVAGQADSLSVPNLVLMDLQVSMANPTKDGMRLENLLQVTATTL
jgi:hypothetical protein